MTVTHPRRNLKFRSKFCLRSGADVTLLYLEVVRNSKYVVTNRYVLNQAVGIYQCWRKMLPICGHLTCDKRWYYIIRVEHLQFAIDFVVPSLIPNIIDIILSKHVFVLSPRGNLAVSMNRLQRRCLIRCNNEHVPWRWEAENPFRRRRY